MVKLLLVAVAIGALGTRPALADGVTCDPASKKLEWHLCIVKEVEYKKGMKVETRSECVQDTVVKAADGCKLENLATLVPKGTNHELVYFYAIGPKDWDLGATHEMQQVQKKPACRLGMTTPELYMLMKFGDAMDKSNAERTAMVADKLKAKGKKVVTGVVFQATQPDLCAGADAQVGLVDLKTSSKFLVYANTSW